VAVVQRLIVSASLLASIACVVQPPIAVVPRETRCRTTIPASLAPTVRWVGPDESRDRARLDEWCATVGPLVIVQHSALRPIAERLTVVTWNTHAGAGQLDALVRALGDGRLTDGVPVRHFILLLQEVLRSGPEVPDSNELSLSVPNAIGRHPDASVSITEWARRLELNALYVPSMRNGLDNEDRGNAIVSSLPLDDALVIELPFERQRRVAVSSAIRLRTNEGSERRLRVVSAHFDTSVALWRGGPAKARRRQARALIEALRDDNGMMIVGGDFNSWWGDDEPAVKDLRAAFPDAKAAGREATWAGPLGAASRVDYLFARLAGSVVDVRRIGNRFGSDHHPLVATLDVAALGKPETR
jgi:endonuclease/exonuclease/phosphatase family metal-dependent hydrolase